MSSNLESQFLTKLDSKILKIQTIAKFSIDKHVDKIKSKQVNIDAKLNKKSKKQLKEESFINPEKIKQETGVNPNLDTYSADRIQKCNKWITYWAKQEQFKNLPNLKLDIKSNFGSLGTFLPPREAHKLEQRRMIEEDKSMTEAMESFRVKFEESKKYEEYGAFEFPDWKILDKEPTMEGLRNLYNSQWVLGFLVEIKIRNLNT